MAHILNIHGTDPLDPAQRLSRSRFPTLVYRRTKGSYLVTTPTPALLPLPLEGDGHVRPARLRRLRWRRPPVSKGERNWAAWVNGTPRKAGGGIGVLEGTTAEEWSVKENERAYPFPSSFFHRSFHIVSLQILTSFPSTYTTDI